MEESNLNKEGFQGYEEKTFQSKYLTDIELVELESLASSLAIDGDVDPLDRYRSIAETEYAVVPLKSVHLTGYTLKAFSRIIRAPGIGPLIIRRLKKKNKLNIVKKFASELDDLPLYYPIQAPTAMQLKTCRKSAENFSLEKFIETEYACSFPAKAAFNHWTIYDYVSRYKKKEITPLQVAYAIIDLVEESNTTNPPLRAIICINKDDLIQQATASTHRYMNGRERGVIDGVPIAIKDQIDVKNYKTTLGASFFAKQATVATEDSHPVALLREAGGMIIGKTNLHEIGLGTTGNNSYFGIPQNPYKHHHYTGGSSSGSAAAVASGLVPVAIGTDSGGSVRIPAGLCGVIGLKGTFKRVAMDFYSAPSVTHLGIIAGCATDAAVIYAILGGSREDDTQSLIQPPMHLGTFSKIKDLSDVRIGIYWDFFNDADEVVVIKCKQALARFKQLGATIVDIAIPHIKEINLAHKLTVLTEMVQATECIYKDIDKLSLEGQISISIGRSFSGRDFLSAQRVRAYATRTMKKIFQTVSIIGTPSTSSTAPSVPKSARLHGESNVKQTTTLMKFMSLGNFIGIPGIVFPVGYDKNGLPISMQLQSDHWEEDTLLRLAKVAESFLPNGILKPKIYYSVIDRSKEFEESFALSDMRSDHILHFKNT